MDECDAKLSFLTTSFDASAAKKSSSKAQQAKADAIIKLTDACDFDSELLNDEINVLKNKLKHSEKVIIDKDKQISVLKEDLAHEKKMRSELENSLS